MQLLEAAKALAGLLGRKGTQERDDCPIGRLPLGIGMDTGATLAECHRAWTGQSNKIKDRYKFVRHVCG